MKSTPLPMLVSVALLAGCMAAPANSPGASGTPTAQRVATTQGAAESLPFISVFADMGTSRSFAAGPGERTVLRTRAELDAFLARHPRAVPPGSVPGMLSPRPHASVTPPGSAPGPGGPAPGGAPPAPEEWPPQLLDLDFTRYQAIAFFDGAVSQASTSRITAVVDQGGALGVATTRWEAPAGAGYGPDVNGRLHIVAVARTEKPVTFGETAVASGLAKEGEGGLSFAGGPMMNPKWKAVPNPEVTREKVEAFFRSTLRGAAPTEFSVEKRTIAWIKANVSEYADRGNYTLDSEMWVAIAAGDLPFNGPGGGMAGIGPVVGASEPRASRVVMLIPIEELHPQHIMTTPGVSNPGMRFMLQPERDMHLGEDLTFQVTGEPVDGDATLTLTVGTSAPVMKRVAFRDMATFSLTLDKANLPGLADVAVQTLSIKLDWEMNPGAGAGMSREIKVTRDRDVLPAPSSGHIGWGTIEEYKLAPGETAADAFARHIATTSWKGEELKITSRAAKLSDVKPDQNTANDLAADTPVRIYEIRGRFPKFLVPAMMSATAVDEVMAPAYLVMTLTEALAIRTLSIKAHAK